MTQNSIGGRLGTSSTQDILLLALVAVGGYVVYKIFQQIQAGEQALVKGGQAVYSGAQTLTAPVSSALASAWSAMTLQPSVAVQGNVVFPNGTQTPLSNFVVKTDTLGNVYINDATSGLLYQLQPHDGNGNYPAIAITDPSQIGTNMGLTSSNFPAGGTVAPDFGVSDSSTWGNSSGVIMNLNGLRLGAYTTHMPRSNPAPMRGPRILRPRRG